MKKSLLVLGASVFIGMAMQPVVALAAGDESAVAEYTDSVPMPSGNLRVTHPTIVWPIAPDHGRITHVRMQINGRDVPATYDTARQAVVFFPMSPLQPGAYTVKCCVTFDRDYNIDRQWSFTVADGAVDALIAPTLAQLAVCAEINAARLAMRLPVLTIDSRLCAAAGGHAAYLAQNHTLAHEQDAALPGYTAATPADRAGTFGYDGECYESVSAGAPGAAAIHRLLDAPYHRAPFLQPGSYEVGSGAESDVVTLLFGVSRDTDVVTYPYDGQKDVPTAWDGVESPNPLRMYRLNEPAGPTGYPVTLFCFGPASGHVKVRGATLTSADGSDVPAFVNTPDNDDNLENGVVLIPRTRLRAGTTYRVAVDAIDSAGHSVSRTWSFTTAPAPHPAAPSAKSAVVAKRH